MRIEVEEIEEICKKDLADYKVPKIYIFKDQPLPRTASGKIKKYKLIEEVRKVYP